MKIMNRKDFLALPSGVLFSKYEPCVFDSLAIKLQTLETDDYIYQSIEDSVQCDSGWSPAAMLENAQETGASLAMDFDSAGRDGCFDADQLFAVWEKDDVQALIALLFKVLMAGK